LRGGTTKQSVTIKWNQIASSRFAFAMLQRKSLLAMTSLILFDFSIILLQLIFFQIAADDTEDSFNSILDFLFTAGCESVISGRSSDSPPVFGAFPFFLKEKWLVADPLMRITAAGTVAELHGIPF
jgi:hypothetical protein